MSTLGMPGQNQDDCVRFGSQPPGLAAIAAPGHYNPGSPAHGPVSLAIADINACQNTLSSSAIADELTSGAGAFAQGAGCHDRAGQLSVSKVTKSGTARHPAGVGCTNPRETLSSRGDTQGSAGGNLPARLGARCRATDTPGRLVSLWSQGC